MQVKLTHATYNVETGKLANELDIARIAGICYDKSRCDIDTLVNCLKSGHMEVFEHFKYTFLVEGLSRDALQELARHEVGIAKTVRGTRFNDCTDDDITFPDKVKSDPAVYMEWVALHEHSAAVYEATRQRFGEDEGPDIAKGALLGANQCKLYISFDLLAFMHFLSQRECKRAYFDMRDLAKRMRAIMEPLLPTVIGQYSGPPCKTGQCREQKPCSG
jgi:thymidylate synthase (FAD)